MSDRLGLLADRDYATGALVCIHEARREMEYDLERADETLAVAQRLAVMGGAHDIGSLENGRAFPSVDADDDHDCTDSDQMTEENADTKPTCYACGASLGVEWKHADAQDDGGYPPDCPTCGENPLPPVGVEPNGVDAAPRASVGRPQCYACGAWLATFDVGANGNALCPECGENPLPPTGAEESDA